MYPDDYLHSYDGDDMFLQYFTKKPLKHWDFDQFARHFSLCRKKTLISKYSSCLASIRQSAHTPVLVKDWIKVNLSTIKSKTTTSAATNNTTIINQPQGQHQPSTLSHSSSTPLSPPPKQQQQQQQPHQQQQQEQQQPAYIRRNAITNSRPMNTESWDQFKKNHDKMEDRLKWKLSTGRYVEDIIYERGLKLGKECCLHSFILDINDDDVRSLFDDDELEEVISTQLKQDPDLPTNVYELLQDLNSKNANDIHAVLWDSTRQYEDYNTRSIVYAVDSLTMLLDATPNQLQLPHLGEWYQANIWVPLVYKMYGDVPDVSCELGEALSEANKYRIRRLDSGSDMVLRWGSGVALGYGVVEDWDGYDGAFERQRMHEAELILPKTLKDMMMTVCDDYDCDATMMKKMEIVGYCHSGTVTEFMVIDNPSGYVCRLSRSRHYEVPESYNELPKLLLLLAISMRMKLRVKRCIDTFKKRPLDLESPTMLTSKRTKSSCLADNLTTPSRPVKVPATRRNPY